MKINRIIKKDSKNIIINLDDNRSFFINYEVLIKNGLRKNDEISEKEIESLIRQNQSFAVKQRAFRLLARRLHSENELRTKLKQKNYNAEIIDETIIDLKKNNYLNDLSFAEAFSVEMINRLWGKNKIKAGLLKRGVSNEIISAVLLKNFPEGDVLDSALLTAQKKFKSLRNRNYDQKKIREKLFAFLYSKGYEYDVAKEAIDQMINIEEEFES